MNIREELGARAKHVEEVLATFLPEESGTQKTILEAMNYSLLAGGKRIRPILMEEAYKMFAASNGKETKAIYAFMAAMEMIHTYSLVHDDLPAMDNDEYRRGKKTTHAVYGEAMGILAGDALLNYAFETACKAFTMTNDLKRVADALTVLSRKAGIYGMIGGQVIDLKNENRSAELKTLQKMDELKTGALIKCAALLGCIAAEADEKKIEAATEYASKIGQAFQIVDDILDATSNEEELGKSVGSDSDKNKTTFLSFFSVEQAKAQAEDMTASAIKQISDIDSNERLVSLALYLCDRKK